MRVCGYYREEGREGEKTRNHTAGSPQLPRSSPASPATAASPRGKGSGHPPAPFSEAEPWRPRQGSYKPTLIWLILCLLSYISVT